MPPDTRALIARHFNVSQNMIVDIERLDATNEVYSFTIADGVAKHVIRIPAGSYRMYPARERAVYEAIKALGISDTPLYLDEVGVKITAFFDGAVQIANVEEAHDLLRTLHQSGVKVNHRYEIENVHRWMFPDWVETHRQHITLELLDAQKNIDALVSRLAALETPLVLCHGDACPSNCLRLKDGTLRLIDWEQAGMADPLVDIAVSAVNCGLDVVNAESLLEHYLQRKPSPQEIFRLSAYIAIDCFAWAWWNLQLQESEECRYYYDKGAQAFLQCFSPESR
jgi:hypothetical protein